MQSDQLLVNGLFARREKPCRLLRELLQIHNLTGDGEACLIARVVDARNGYAF